MEYHKYHEDAVLIRNIGVSALAKRLGYSVQRVQNWLYRGIPARVMLYHSDKLFL